MLGALVMETEESIQIKVLDSSRLDAILAIEKLCFPAPWSAEIIGSEFRQRISYIPGIFVEQQLCGYAFNHIVAGELHLLSLAVHPDFRRRGLARLLLSKVLEESKRLGAVHAILEVRVTNLAARELYEKAGFKMVGLRKRYYCDNGEDALVYALQGW